MEGWNIKGAEAPPGVEIPVLIKDRPSAAEPGSAAGQGTALAGDADAGKKEESVMEKAPRDILQEKEEKIEELKEQVKRLSAEFDNFRRRQERRFEESARNALDGIVSEFLPVLDSIRLAHDSASREHDFDRLLKGIELTVSQLDNTLKKLGVEEIPAVGMPFDPAFHHAVVAIETGEHPDQAILEEMQKGYRVGERVIRPSMVKVARTPGG
jgi:molecular chaperone GrpE